MTRTEHLEEAIIHTNMALLLISMGKADQIGFHKVKAKFHLSFVREGK